MNDLGDRGGLGEWASGRPGRPGQTEGQRGLPSGIAQFFLGLLSD